jgi:hypothetical protein
MWTKTGVGMSDLIDREQAIKAIQESEFGFTFEVDVAIEAVKALPTVAPERKKGEWKPFDLTWGRSVYSCTACGETMDIPTEMSKPIYNFCPNCGMDMRGEE